MILKHNIFHSLSLLIGRIVLFILFFSTFSFSQEISARLNHERIKIGEPIELKLVVKLSGNSVISYEPFDKEINASRRREDSQVKDNNVVLEIEGEFTDTTKREGNKITWIGNYNLIAWDTGKIVLPPLKITIDDSSFLFNEVSFSVISETIGVKDELFDIEEGFADVPDKLTFVQLLLEYWYYTAGGILLLAGLIFLLFRGKKKPKKLQKVMSLKDRTLYAIEALEQQKMWMDGRFKEHYTELSHIMRSYLSGRYGLNLLERTTFETKTLLLQKGLPADTVDTFMVILRQADMAKFANSTSDEMNLLKIALMAKQIVAETSPLEIENESNYKLSTKN